MPFYNGHRQNAIHLHGHSHNTEEHYLELGIIQAIKKNGYEPKVYNVGCMLWNYEPVTLEEILNSKNEIEQLEELEKEQKEQNNGEEK